MPRFNPFARVNCQYGAPMGRHGDDPAKYDGGNLYARHCGGDGYYDRGGAYWGHSRVFAVWTRGGAFCAYVEARSAVGAIKGVLDASNDGAAYSTETFRQRWMRAYEKTFAAPRA